MAFEKEIKEYEELRRKYQTLILTSSLKKYVFHNWLINNILYFRVT